MFSIFSKFRKSQRVTRTVSPKVSASKISLESLEDRAVPAIFWVSAEGSNENNGTSINTPFKTISRALEATAVDSTKDTINILPGNYAETMTGPANPTVLGSPTFTYGLYIAPTNPVALQGVTQLGVAITSPGSVAATITAGSTVGGSASDLYNVSNFAIYAPTTDLLGIKFDASVASGSQAPSTDLLAIYANNVSVQNSVIRSGVTDALNPDQPIGTNSSSISIIDPTFTSASIVSSITGYNINNNIIEGGILISHGAGIGATQSNLKITKNTISDGFYGNIAVYGNLNSPDDKFFIYDAALPSIGGTGLGNTLISTDTNAAWRELVYFYSNSALAPTKTQLDAIFAGNVIQDYTYATDSLGNPRITGNTATGGAPGDNNFYGFSVYSNVNQLSTVITDNPQNATANWPVSSTNIVNYSVGTAGIGLVNLTDLTLNPQGSTPANYKLVLGTTPNGTGGSRDVANLTVSGSLATNVDGNAAGNTINGNAGANVLSGLAGVDFLNGNAGDDTLIGGSGNDTLNGGTGTDTVILSGNFNNYKITYNSSTKAFTLLDNRSGSPDGSDSVSNIEYIQFADTKVTVVATASGNAFNTVTKGLANTALGDIIFIGNGNYNENIPITKDVSLVGFGSVVISQATIGGNARLGSTTVNVQVGTVNMNQIGGTRSRPTDAILISLAATNWNAAGAAFFAGDPTAATNQLKSGEYQSVLNLYRRVKLFGTKTSGVNTKIGVAGVAGVIRYTSLINGQVNPSSITFVGGGQTAAISPPAPTPPSDNVYNLPTYV